MENKFYIFVVADSMLGGPTINAVYVKETGKWLEFSDYIEAEAWIKEQRVNGITDAYQIQKLYV